MIPGESGRFSRLYRPQQSEGPFDGQTRRLLLIAGSIACLLLGISIAFTVAYYEPATFVPTIEALDHPVRVRPDKPGGMEIAGLNDQTLDGDFDDTDEKVVLAPAPEEPAPAALQAQIQGVLDAAAVAPSELDFFPPPALVYDTDDLPDSRNGEAQVGVAGSTRATPEAITRAFEVQLAAMDSEPAAYAEWARLQNRLPRLLGSRTPLIQRVKRNDKAVWRLRVAGFSSNPQAQQFCSHLRSAGVACVIAEF